MLGNYQIKDSEIIRGKRKALSRFCRQIRNEVSNKMSVPVALCPLERRCG